MLQGNKMLQAIIFLAIAQSATGIATKPKQMGGVTFCDDREVALDLPVAFLLLIGQDWIPSSPLLDTRIPTTLVEVWSHAKTLQCLLCPAMLSF